MSRDMKLIQSELCLKELRKTRDEYKKRALKLGFDYGCISIGFDTACDVIKATPKIDAKVITHGKWVKTKDTGKWHGICSECGSMRMAEAYCPVCGAQMDL